VKGTGHQACLLLGSNIQPERNLPQAVHLLQQDLAILQVSSVWETPAVGSTGPDFLNAALLAETSLDEKTLKDKILRPLETRLGRIRSADKNAPRTIDLDLIIFDGRLLDPTLWRYAHRAVPVAEVLPGFTDNGGKNLRDAAAQLASSSSIRLRPDVSIHPHLQPS
jgi:2-amino-4-hydroxy-6-hydroxymethyldihydropteridine diphosphokinase